MKTKLNGTVETRTGTLVYFAVPNWTGYGVDFITWQAAEEHALSTIREIDGCPGHFTRAFVDVRVSDATGDRSVHRVEVFAPKAVAA